MTELAVSGIPVAVTCRVLKLSRQPYYRWLRDPVTPSEVIVAYRANALFDAHKDDPEFGHRLLADEARDAGEAMADRTAWRIASENGWWSAFGKKRGKNGKKPGPAVHDDLCTVTDEKGRVRHEFTAAAPNQLWLTDITEHKTAWIPAIVATPVMRSWDAGEEIYGAAAGHVHGPYRSGRFGSCRRDEGRGASGCGI